MTVPRTMYSLMAPLLAAWLGLTCASQNLCAQQQATSAGKAQEKEKEKDVTWLRCWAAVGESAADSACTVTYVAEDAKDELPLFKGVRGCWSSGIGTGYFALPPGKYHLRLRRDSKPDEPAVELKVELKKDHANTLLAAVTQDNPLLQLIPELPTLPEAHGVYIYNLLADTPLNLSLGTAPPVLVPHAITPSVLTPSQAMGQNLVLWFQSRRKTRVETPVDYTGGRLSILLMRNNYNQPAVQLFPARPSQLP